MVRRLLPMGTAINECAMERDRNAIGRDRSAIEHGACYSSRVAPRFPYEASSKLEIAANGKTKNVKGPSKLRNFEDYRIFK